MVSLEMGAGVELSEEKCTKKPTHTHKHAQTSARHVMVAHVKTPSLSVEPPKAKTDNAL